MAREILAVVTSVNYRLAPEHKYLSEYDDGFDVLKFIDEGNFDRFPASAVLTRCFISGDSVGWNLAHHMDGIEDQANESASMEWTDWMWKSLLPNGLD
ncbi:hypothetical protein SLEP1_g23477 [Rubroshorea leprosula]|uniref:Alpha/beta hydrolase fold-3 domain-containing protein n=1 Tax=Rubroshorea leprosula TaxID=152421 RepID=A0AAV5JIP9_9ROSI|nr:hypothetical protein SLEP1_g23477 [Rubroshorea leprosula]